MTTIDNIDRMSIDEFASKAVSMATRMGLERTRDQLLDLLDRHDADAVVKACVHMMTVPSSDTYSGRTNDLQRAYNDGVRRVAGTVLSNALQFGEPPTQKSIERIR
jgi:hypothetical protein